MCRSPRSSYLYQGEISLTFLTLFSVVESWKSGLICDCSALLSLQQWLHVFSILFLKPEHCCEQGPRSPSLLAITLPSLIYTTFFLQDCLEYLWYPEMHLNTGGLFIFLLYFFPSVKLPSPFPFQYAAFNILSSEMYLFFSFILLHLLILLLPILSCFPNCSHWS